jgi:hypothetical protein
MMKAKTLALALLAGTAGTAGCGGAQTQYKTVKFGAVIDKTGSIANPTWPPAVELAVAHANEGLQQAMNPKGFRFAATILDSTNVTSVAASRALELKAEGAKAIITDTSGDSIAINKLNYDADTGNDLDVPLICQACTSPDINNPNAVNASDPVDQATKRNEKKWFFRSTMDSDPQAIVMMNIAMAAAPTATPRGDVNGDGKFKASVIAISDSYGNGFADGLKRAAMALNLTPEAVVEVIGHPRDAVVDSYDWATAVSQLTDDRNEGTMMTDGRPDIIMVIDFPQYGAAITKAFLDSGATTRLLHSHNFRHESVVLKLQSRVNGQQGTSHVLLDGPSGDAFAQAFSAANNGTAPEFWASNTYDSAMVIMLGIYAAAEANKLDDITMVTGAQVRDAMNTINDKTGEKIRSGAAEFAKAVAALKEGRKIDYEGASGPMDFDANGNVNGKLARWVYQNNRFDDVDRYDCVASRTTCPPIQ